MWDNCNNSRNPILNLEKQFWQRNRSATVRSPGLSCWVCRSWNRESISTPRRKKYVEKPERHGLGKKTGTIVRDKCGLDVLGSSKLHPYPSLLRVEIKVIVVSHRHIQCLLSTTPLIPRHHYVCHHLLVLPPDLCDTCELRARLPLTKYLRYQM